MPDLIIAITNLNLLGDITPELVKDEFDLLKFMITISYSIISFAFLAVTAIASFVGFTKIQTLNELKEGVNDLVEQAVAKEIAERVNKRIEDVERIVKQEVIAQSANIIFPQKNLVN